MIKYFRSYKRQWMVGIGLFAMLAMVISFVIPGLVQADDVTGSVTVTGGSLSMGAPGSTTFSGVTFDTGADKTSSASFGIDVNDATGSGAGWHLQISASPFTSADSDTLATDALTVDSILASCDNTGGCTSPVNTLSGSYPLSLAADGIASFFIAQADSGLGDFTVTPTFGLDIPATTYADIYTSTMTITIVSGQP